MVFLFDHMVGDNDFAANFASVAEERKEAEERRQAEFILKLLDELETRDTGSEKSEHFERLVAIDEDGLIRRTRDEFNKRAKFHNKVNTIKDLPYESEWEQVFGPQPEPEALVTVQSGRRVVDGDKVHMLKANDTNETYYWRGVSPVILLVLGIAFFFLFLGMLQVMRQKKQRKVNEQKVIAFQQQLDHNIDRRVQYHIYRITANDFR